MKKQLLISFLFISLFSFGQAPQRFNKVIVTGDITSPKFIKTGSNADSVLLGNGSARAISTVKTDTVNLSNRINAKATGNGTANGTNTGDETLTSIKTKLGAATSVSDGYLKYQDFVRFDGKQPAGAYLTAEVDGSTTNELNSSSAWDNATNTISVTDAGGAKSAVITGFLESEVDGSVTNELQTISTNGAAGNITLSNSGGTLNLNVNDADASTTNEIQDLSLSGNTLTLSSDATTVNISQATSVLANTAKVSNATHTGDVTGSTALTLATVNSNIGTYNNVTINAKGLATAGSNVGYLTGITSGQVTTALGYTPYNSTNPNSYIPLTSLSSTATGLTYTNTTGVFSFTSGYSIPTTANQSNWSTAYGWGNHAGLYRPISYVPSYLQTAEAYPVLDLNNVNSNLKFSYSRMLSASTHSFPMTGNANAVLTIDTYDGTSAYMQQLGFSGNGNMYQRSGIGNWNTVWTSGNLTNSLSTNYIPKWNGSSMVNSLISDDGTNLYSNANLVFSNNQTERFIRGTAFGGAIRLRSNAATADDRGIQIGTCDNSGAFTAAMSMNSNSNNFLIHSTTPSTSPTNGALVVNGGVGADHVRANNFYGNGSNLTGIQLPITLTTNGTSGAATFSGNVLNVPNYAESGGVNQAQTTFNGSTSGTIVCSMPFQTGSYKKVMIIFSSLNGNGTSTYTYPVAFTNDPAVILYNYTGTPASTTLGKSSIIFSGTASNYKGCMILEGY